MPIVRTIRYLFVLAVVALGGAAVACKDANEQRAPARDTTAARGLDSAQVLAFLAAVNQSEVEAGQIGTRRASNTEVRQYGQLLWREHAQSGRDVAELARQMEVDLRAVAPPNPLIANLRGRSQETTQLLNRIPKSAGFDRTFLDSQVRAHQALLQDLRRIAADSSRLVSASLAPGGGVDVGVTGRPDAAAADSARLRTSNRKAENAQEAVQIMLALVQQHLERGRQLQAKLGSTSSPPAPSTAPAPRRRGGARP